MLIVSTTSEASTRAVGAAIGHCLAAGDLVAISGPLGAGKTRLVQGLCEGLGVPPEEVSSPTFALVHTYPASPPVFHVDLYRIADEDELEATGLLDLSPEGVTLVEWAERAPGFTGRRTVRVTMTDTGATTRRLSITCDEADLEARLREAVYASGAGSVETRVDSSGG